MWLANVMHSKRAVYMGTGSVNVPTSHSPRGFSPGTTQLLTEDFWNRFNGLLPPCSYQQPLETVETVNKNEDGIRATGLKPRCE
jgi:hypothetical protein